MNSLPYPDSRPVYRSAVAAIAGFLLITNGLAEEAALSNLLNRIEQHEDKSFALEKQARVLESHGLVPFWDRMNAASPVERFKVLEDAGVESFTLGKETARQTYDMGIEEVRYGEGGGKLDAAGWQELVKKIKDEGYQITHSDWHQEKFEINKDGNPVSDTRFTIQGNRNDGRDRMEVKATVRVTWRKDGEQFLPTQVAVLTAKVRRRSAEPSFAKLLNIRLEPPALQGKRLDMDDGACFVRDLNGDQFPDIVTSGHNKILWNRGGRTFEVGDLFAGDQEATLSRTGLLADVDGDGIADWVCDNNIKGTLEYHPGLKETSLKGAFAGEGIPIPLEAHPLKVPTAITAGDIDHDGDLDLFIAQYRTPQDTIPEKYWDANDGYGNTLLINDGKGKFTDQTAAAGLGPKQFRRTYSASFVDIDTDGDLDLVVVSDFCGTDLYLNDGKGKFTDATGKDLDEPHTFGMSHTIADYNNDGKLDLYVTGMSSTTSRRLERMAAFPAGYDDANKMRAVMGYGNRMYLAGEKGVFAQPTFKDNVARTGWSWGSTSFDFDNDGDEDIYVANGHITGKTTEDYCSSFWCHDIYILPGVKGSEMQSYLKSIPNREKISWDGFQVNSLLVNQSGKDFQDLSYMMDTGFDYDARQTVATDLDLDGRVDLIVSHLPGPEEAGNGKDWSSLTLYKNVLKEAADRDWIGVSLVGKPGLSELGAIVELETSKGIRRQTVISGDSFLCQHPAQKHFGIEPGNKVKSLTVIWPDGSKTVEKDPELRRYYVMTPPAEG